MLVNHEPYGEHVVHRERLTLSVQKDKVLFTSLSSVTTLKRLQVTKNLSLVRRNNVAFMHSMIPSVTIPLWRRKGYARPSNFKTERRLTYLIHLTQGSVHFAFAFSSHHSKKIIMVTHNRWSISKKGIQERKTGVRQQLRDQQ